VADLTITNVSKQFGDVKAISTLNIDIASGELVVLLGPSGAGKTTTLRLVAGLETPDGGQIHIDGRDVTSLAPALRDVTFVFQQYSLYPHLNVYDNLAFPLRSPLRKTSESDIKSRVTEVARMLQMEDKLLNPATKLSGGQMQRVAIGRALVRNPAIYLMDEPLSSLDAKLRNDLRLEIKRIQVDTGATMLYVTHDQVEALTLASRIGVLDQGHLVQLGTPSEVYKDPNSVAVASRLGTTRINLIPRSILPKLAMPSSTVTVGIRPEDMQIEALKETSVASSRVSTDLVAVVKRIERLSDQYLVHLQIADSEQSLIVFAQPDQLAQAGEQVSIHVKQSLWFDEHGLRVRN
jgi:multiple sugar transport system ATP-binding protein